MSDLNRPERPGLAALWMIGTILSFTAMAVAGRAVSFELDTFEIMTFRSAIGFFVVMAVALATGTVQQISRRHLGVHLVRNVSHFAGQNLWFYALTAAPLAQVIALEFTSPLWVAVLAPLFLGEKLTPMCALAAVIGFSGVLLVAQPWAEPLSSGTITATLAAIGFAGSAIFTKWLTRTENTLTIMFWLTLMQLVFGLIFAGYDGDFAMPSAASVPWLIVIGCAGLSAHYCLTTALGHAPAGLVVQFDFARLPVTALVGVLIYSEPLTAGLVAGGLVILGANVLNLRARRSGHTRAFPNL